MRLGRVAWALALLAGLSVEPAAAQTGPRNCSVTSQNLYVRDVMQDLYLWYSSMPDVNAASFPSPEAYLQAVRYRPLDSSFSYITSAASSDAFYSDSQFIGFGFSTLLSGSELRVLQVFADSPASEAGLARGDHILEIDGRRIEALVASGEITGAFGPSEVGASSEVVFRSRAGEERRERMTKRLVTIPTVSVTRVFELDGRKVGYLFFRNFVRPSFAALDEAFASLAEAGVSELVLDLRYNGGGLVDVAVHLGSLIGGALTAGQPFATYAHNDRNTFRNETLRFEDLDQPAPVLSRLIAITSRSSASASELVINALKPFMPVVTIGDATYGKPVGQYLVRFCDKMLAPVSFSLRNANDEGDYFDGLPATCAAGDGIDAELGDAAEASLAEALHYVRHDACSLPPEAARAMRTRAGGPGLRAAGWQAVLNAH
ncbi:MAG: PDZ domain-containing protein [Acidobacteria bacterium]|nr:PDZ domain-containing protein [Acidobacteriota bacterium]